MKPSNFKEATKTLQKPENMTDKECAPLSVYSDGKICVSCWKPSWKERLSILVFGKVWLGVLSGQTQPPVWIDGSKTVFNKEKVVWTSVQGMIERFEKVFSNDTSPLSIKERILKVWTRDKRLHTLAGFVIALVFGLWFPWLGLGLGVIAGAAKEYWDSRGNGCVELLDFVFTVVGSLIGFALTFFIVSPLIHSLFA